MRHYFVQIQFLFIGLFTIAFAPAFAAAEPGYDIIIVAGQSNALGVGCGPFEDVSRAQDRKIFQLDPNGFVIGAREPLVHAPQHGRAGKGFGMTFARVYAEKILPGRQVLLVPVALGGTSILQWDNLDEGFDFGTPTHNSDPLRNDSTELFDTAIRQTRHALQAGSGKNRIAALLWHQGETDLLFMLQKDEAIHSAMGNVSQYRKRFETLMTLFRGAFPTENFPIVAGELGRFFEPTFPGPNGLTAFNKMLADVAAADGRMAIVSSQGLGNGVAAHCAFWPLPNLPDGDPVHFNAASQVELGKRYYNAFERLKSNW